MDDGPEPRRPLREQDNAPPTLTGPRSVDKVSARMLKQATEARAPESVARLCRALSVETRVRMLALLQRHSLCVGALARALGITDAAVSQHLRVLRDAGLVVAERRGHFVHYAIDPHTVDRWQHAVVGLLSVGDGHTSASSDCEMMRKGGER